MKRVMIIGQPGSGKSTLARQIGDETGLPVVHMDQIHWMPGWVETPLEEKAKLTAQAHARDRWVFEGGYSASWPERLERCDTFIWLDFKLSTRAWRVLKRRVQYHNTPRPDAPADCPERLNLEFARWIWNTRKTGKNLAEKFYDSVPETKTKHRLQNASQVSAFLESTRNLNPL